MEMKYQYAEIAIPLPIFKSFTYSIPEEMSGEIQIGMRVLVPFGQKKVTGYVIDLRTTTDAHEVKNIEDILDERPVLSGKMMQLGRWISEYYLCPLGEVLKSMLPSGINVESLTLISLAVERAQAQKIMEQFISENQKIIVRAVLEEAEISLNDLAKRGMSNLNLSISKLERSGIIRKSFQVQVPKARPKMEKWIRISPQGLSSDDLIDQLSKKSPKQYHCLKLIREMNEVSQIQLLKLAGVSMKILQSLLIKGFAERYEKEVFRDYYQTLEIENPEPLVLTDDQHQAVKAIHEAISAHIFKTFLLFGVTGSGKTQVYIETLKTTLKSNLTAIILVPEISLTPQTVSRFTACFPGQIAVFHSRMSVGERYDSWRRLREGKCRIAIGPRSAIFAPLENIGLIIVDEEHEPSYKQTDTAPFYHARDVAVVRAKLNKAIVILGSATPSFESFLNARMKKYHLLELSSRVNHIPMPQVTIVEMLGKKMISAKEQNFIFSKQLLNKIEEKLDAKEQIILLQNRRGFSNFIQCADCGHIEKCVHCTITLTYHINTHRLRCHYCNYVKKAPESCPACGSHDLLYHGVGTQQVEAAVYKAFPNARVVRMDLDTTLQRKSHDRILNDFGQHKFDVLLGTQMVAKGHDFGGVTLVGVINADTSLSLPDFRASERTFQLLTQVAGRAGRKNLTGEVIIQTYLPFHVSILCAKTHDYQKFYSIEIQGRKELNYPPFSRLIQILVKGEEESRVIAVINRIKELLSVDERGYQILGPVPTPISKINKNFRWHLILKVNKQMDPTGQSIHRILLDAEAHIRPLIGKEKIRMNINVDPVSLL